MSRSTRKNPIIGITIADSEAFDKASWHRAFRRAENVRLATDPESETHHFHEFSNPWLMHKDGKQRVTDLERLASDLRK